MTVVDIARSGGFTITVPPSWFCIDVDPRSRNAAIDSLVDASTRSVPELAVQRDALRRLLRRVAREAHASGAVYCAAMAEAADGIGMSASVTVSLLDGEGLSGSGPSAIAATLATLATLREKVPPDNDDTWQTVSIVELPEVGRAARSYGVEDVPLPGRAESLRCVLMQTFIPLPGETRVAVVSCHSPNLALVDSYLDLFDAITSTFRFVSGDSQKGP